MKVFSALVLLASIASASASSFPLYTAQTVTTVAPPSGTGAFGTGALGTGAAASSGLPPHPNNNNTATPTTVVTSVTHVPVGPTTSAPATFQGAAAANVAGVGLAVVGMGFALFL